MSSFVELITESPTFYSHMDEQTLFEWIQQIKPVHDVRGEISFLRIKIKLDDLDEEEFRELIAVFKRFGLRMSELKKLDTGSFSEWFRNPRAYWYEQVFN
jgi:two-component SAPR family response regulator